MKSIVSIEWFEYKTIRNPNILKSCKFDKVKRLRTTLQIFELLILSGYSDF